jgi:hypothetical protein
MSYASRPHLPTPNDPEGQLKLLYQRLALLNQVISDLEAYGAAPIPPIALSHPVLLSASQWPGESQRR